MVLLSVALLSALVTAGPLYGSATARGVLVRALAAIPPQTPPISRPMLEVTVADPKAGTQPQIEELFRSVPNLEEPETTIVAHSWRIEQKFKPQPFIRSATGQASALLYHRTGAVTGLPVAEGTPGASGLWLPEPLAEKLAVGPGSSVVVGKDYAPDKPIKDTATTLTVAGTYETRPDGRTPLGPAFTNVVGGLPADPKGLPGADGALLPAYLLIGDLKTISEAVTATREETLLTLAAELSSEGHSPQKLKETADAVSYLQLQAKIPSSESFELLRVRQEARTPPAACRRSRSAPRTTPPKPA